MGIALSKVKTVGADESFFRTLKEKIVDKHCSNLFAESKSFATVDLLYL